MEKNKTGKYLKYAIGEIFLVVIGILIALQINNWNEDRKKANFEKDILTQTKLNLEKDHSALSKFAANGNRAVASANKVLSLAPGSENDSLRYWLADIIQFDRFQPLTSAYEALKSKGLDLVSNRELRFVLGSYYDDKVPFMIKAFEDIEWSFHNEWLPMTRKYVLDFKFKKYILLNNYTAYTTPTEIRNSLIMNRDNWSGSVKYMGEGLALIEDLIVMINAELGPEEL